MVRINVEEDPEHMLPLPLIMARALGFRNSQDILKRIKAEGSSLQKYEFSSEKSNFLKFILGFLTETSDPYKRIVTEERLGGYDINIKAHLDRINHKRSQKIDLMPFQYLALLYSEIYFDNLFSDKHAFLELINECVKDLKRKELPADDLEYSGSDLEKICFWMATGSGKTIIMHINYLQYLHYHQKHANVRPLNNVILLDPHEDLSKQHQRKLWEQSEIEARLIDGKNLKYKIEGIKILDFNKLRDKEERGQSKTQGITVDVSYFKENNLILVDEGHRGTSSSGGTWLQHRKQIAKEGFTIEYSATFHDVLTDKNYRDDYRRSILFNYSYRYFHEDGYGKDYNISNLPKKLDLESQEYIMLANLLSFYEQKRYYIDNKGLLDEKFNIKNPLWILVGSSVQKKDGKGGEKEELESKTRSDIMNVVFFLNKLTVHNEPIINLLKQIRKLELNLKDRETNKNYFEGRYTYLWEIFENSLNGSYKRLLDDIFQKVFYSSPGQPLVLSQVTSGDGEVGLKYGRSSPYFGLVYIGKGSESKLVEDILKDPSGSTIVKDPDRVGLFIFCIFSCEDTTELYNLFFSSIDISVFNISLYKSLKRV